MHFLRETNGPKGKATMLEVNIAFCIQNSVYKCGGPVKPNFNRIDIEI